jgi:hypothetical protein
MTTATATITDSQIRSLRREAAEAQDLVTVHACDVALGVQEPVTTPAAWEERYGGGGHDADERRAVLAIADTDAARAICAEAIADAAAQG